MFTSSSCRMLQLHSHFLLGLGSGASGGIIGSMKESWTNQRSGFPIYI